MQVRDWITICSAVIVVIGWFVNSFINRRHEMAKKRMEYRLEALNSFFPVFFSIQRHRNPFEDDPNLLLNLESSRSKFQIYGQSDEIETFESMVRAIESQNVDLFLKKAQELVLLVRKRIRDQVGLS
jgi:hypothetical protein